jgi:hypothetical protein
LLVRTCAIYIISKRRRARSSMQGGANDLQNNVSRKGMTWEDATIACPGSPSPKDRMADGTSTTSPRRNMTHTSTIVVGTDNKLSKTFI